MLGGDAELDPRLAESQRLLAGESEAQPDDIPLGFGQVGHQVVDSLVAIGVRHFLMWLGAVAGQ